jgi:DNA-binding NarL/FixJ family response regulator
MEMPGMNGIEFRKQLESAAPQSKVLLTTGNHAVIDEASARLIGFRGLIYKPFSVAALKKTLEEAGAFAPEHRSADEVIFSRPI